MENAAAFVQKLRGDQELYAGLADTKPEEILSAAAKMGMQFTEEELKEALGTVEVSAEEMDDVAGGRTS